MTPIERWATANPEAAAALVEGRGAVILIGPYRYGAFDETASCVIAESRDVLVEWKERAKGYPGNYRVQRIAVRRLDKPQPTTCREDAE